MNKHKYQELKLNDVVKHNEVIAKNNAVNANVSINVNDANIQLNNNLSNDISAYRFF